MTLYCMGDTQVNTSIEKDCSPTLTARQYKDPPVTNGGGCCMERVRRLTPLECERLQGFQDGWTDIPYKGKDHPPDSVRYKALGNSFAVPVVKWIGERIEEVEGICSNSN